MLIPPIHNESRAISLPSSGRGDTILLCGRGRLKNSRQASVLKKKDYKNGIIGYKRAKTRHSRRDEAYMEIRIEPFIQDTFNKYLSTDQTDEYLFNFHSRYSNSDSFNANINMGIRRICQDMVHTKCYLIHICSTIVLSNGCPGMTKRIKAIIFLLGHSHILAYSPDSHIYTGYI